MSEKQWYLRIWYSNVTQSTLNQMLLWQRFKLRFILRKSHKTKAFGLFCFDISLDLQSTMYCKNRYTSLSLNCTVYFCDNFAKIYFIPIILSMQIPKSICNRSDHLCWRVFYSPFWNSMYGICWNYSDVSLKVTRSWIHGATCQVFKVFVIDFDTDQVDQWCSAVFLTMFQFDAASAHPLPTMASESW